MRSSRLMSSASCSGPVVRASPVGFFEESALEAFGKALFSPGKMLGVAVKSQITVEVEFMPINRGATVSGRTY